MSAECRSCGKPIEWVLTRNAKRMPLDAFPSMSGDFVIDTSDDIPVCRKATPEDVGRYPHRTSHFATCPNATQHRKPR